MIAGGGGMVVIEEMDHGWRAAPPSMPRLPAMAPIPTVTTWSPVRRGRGPLHGTGAERFDGKPIEEVDYNAHGTSTPVGDVGSLMRFARSSPRGYLPTVTDEIADRSPVWRDRSPGGDLHADHDEGRLYRRLGEY